MTNAQDGGPMFPRTVVNYGKEPISVQGFDVPPGMAVSFSGAQVREWMAGVIVAGMVVSRTMSPNRIGYSPKWTANKAVELADAMIEALREKPE